MRCDDRTMKVDINGPLSRPKHVGVCTVDTYVFESQKIFPLCQLHLLFEYVCLLVGVDVFSKSKDTHEVTYYTVRLGTAKWVGSQRSCPVRNQMTLTVR